MLTCLFLFCAITACNNRQYVLEYKLHEDTVYSQQTEIKVNNRQQLHNDTLELKNTLTIVLNNKVEKLTDSITTINAYYDYISQNWEYIESEFNSEDTTVTATLKNPAPLLRVIKHIPFKISINKYGLIDNIAGFDTVYTTWLNTVDTAEIFNEETITLVERDLGLNAFKTTVSRFTAIFPDHPVKVGDSWKIVDKHYGNFIITLNGELKLQKVKNNIATIKYNADIIALPADNTTDISGLATTYDLKGTQVGEVSVNILNGFINEGEMTQTLSGTVKMKRQKPAASIEIPVELIIRIKQKNIRD